MIMHTFLIRIFRTGLLGAMLWLLPMAFTACDRPAKEVDISLSTDYRGIAEAIRSGSLSLAEALAKIDKAVTGGFADQAAATQLLQLVVTALDGTAEEKLAAIEAAVKSQTASLDTKLGLIEAAAAGGFADSAAQRALIAAALSSIAGEAGEKLAAIEAAVQGQTASLAMKLGLIETAAKEGLSGGKEMELLLKALGALDEEAGARLEALAGAMAGQAASLSTKLDLLTLSLDNGLADEQAAISLVQKAVEALDDTVEESLAAVDDAIGREQLSLEVKMSLVEAAVTKGFADAATLQAMLKKALDGLDSSAETKLAAIESAVKNQAATLASKLGLIETAVAQGFAADSLQQGLIKDALKALAGSATEKLVAIDTAMTRRTASLATKLETIQLTYADSLANASEAVGLMATAVAALDADTKDVAQKLRSIASTSLNSLLVEALTNIKKAIQGMSDDNDILAAILEAIEALDTPLAIEYEDFVIDNVLVMGDTTLRVPYTLLADNLQVVATATEGIQVIVVPDPDNPRKGWLEITAGGITTGSSKVEVTISGQFKSHTHTLELEKEWLKPDPDTQDKNLNFDESFDEANPLIFTYKTNTPGIVSVPDSSKTWVRLLSATSHADGQTPDTIKIAIDRNMGFKMRQTGLTVKNRVSIDILTFLIQQDYYSTVIDFADSGLGSYLVAEGKSPVVDINRDKKICMAEAIYVTSLNTLFDTGSSEGRSYTRFNEFQYFTGITSLPDGSFKHWTNLEEITFPESLTSIQSVHSNASGLLTDCPRLTTIQGKFSVDDRAVVYNKTLLAVASGYDTSYSIPEGVTTIGSRCFYGMEKLGVPASVKEIKTSAFEIPESRHDSLHIYFKGKNPPETCEEDLLGDRKSNVIRVHVPAVIVDGSVDVAQTNARIEAFKTAFGSDAARVKFSYYTEWPFDEGISVTATIARKRAYTGEIASDSLSGKWLKNESIAVLYEVGGVHKRADARITSVKPNGVASIWFTVDKNVPDNSDIACTLVYPLSAVNDANTGPKSYSDMANSQDGTPYHCLDVHIGAGTIHTGDVPALSISTPLKPIYGVVRFETVNDIGKTPCDVQELVVTSHEFTTTISSEPRSEFYVALPPLSEETISVKATDSNKQYPTRTLPYQTIEAGKYYRRTITL